jgi:hypothetical protein
LPTSNGPEYETDVLLLGGNDGPLAATFSAMGVVGQGSIDAKHGAIREPTSCITRRFEACWRADHTDHAQKRHLIREGIEADEFRATQHQRLRALVEADMTVAGSLHSEDFQLINPSGETLSKVQYLGAVASGEIDYLVWEPEAIEGYA